jgi:hypothetical protein
MAESKRYKASYLSTSRSRKMRTFFVQANKDKGAVIEARERMSTLYPEGELVSVQRPDRQFIDMGAR